MKITIERASLLRSLAHVQSVVERRNTIPILSNVLIEAGEGKMTLTATDMDLTVLEEVIADVGTPGATTAPAHVLYDIVRKLPEGAQVELVGEGDRARLQLRSGRSSFQLSTLPKDDFPPVGFGELPVNFSLSQDDLCHLIDRTRFAISTEETRYYLNGIYLHVGHKRRYAGVARRSDGRPPVGAVSNAATGRRRRNARHHSTAQDSGRITQTTRQFRSKGSDLAV